MKQSVREKSLSILIQVEAGTVFPAQALNEADSLFSDARDRGLLRSLVYGVEENRTYLDWILDQFSAKPMRSQKASLRGILRMGAYELVMTRIPAHAAVNEAVKLTRKKADYAKGYVNALLRSLSRSLPEIAEVKAGDELERLSIRYSHPLWILKYMRRQFSITELEEILKKNNAPSPVSLFVNSGRMTREEVIDELRDVLIHPRKSRLSQNCILCDGGPITATSLFQTGVISIQSQPSIRVAEIAAEGIRPDAKILDLCAAPGGKSMAMHILSGARIHANDVAEEKLRILKENAERLGNPSLEVSARDAAEFYPDWKERYDVVLVDAPCSGLGLLGRKPDIRWNRKESDLQELSSLQKKILSNAAFYVKKGGRLVYSTCTYGERENENVIDFFLSHSDASWKREEIDGKDSMHTSPLSEGADGFFMCRFIKMT